MNLEPSYLHRYEEIRQEGLKALNNGSLDQAYELFDRAYQLAQRHGDEQLVDRAYCNRAAVAIEVGSPNDYLPALRRILTSHRDLENSRLAAYNIAQIYQLRKDYKKGLFYARIARDLSVQLDKAEWVASSHNRIGNLLLAESYFDEAAQEYERALALFGPELSLQRAILLENVGYCRIVQGHHDEGFRLLFDSLRGLRRLGARGFQVYPHLSLCYAYVEIDRPRHALRHGAHALILAQSFRNQDCSKYAYYLLGQACQLMGARDAARQYLLRLQEHFYPQSPEIVDFLLAVDVHRMINIKA